MNTPLEDWIRERTPLWEKPMEKCGACPSRQRAGAAAPAGGASRLPTQEEILSVLGDLVAFVSPLCFSADGVPEPSSAAPAPPAGKIACRLHALVAPVRRYYREVVEGAACDDADAFAREATDGFLRSAPDIRRMLQADLRAAYEGDPAARSEMEVLLAYPGFHAIAVHRVAHRLRELGVPLLPRVMSEHAHSRTGIDIHPGATIGPGFFIDHGTGVVIGETCVIGSRVKLYQGVTLGALSFDKDENGNLVKGIKRHPDVEDNVVVYAGATILGGRTVIGHDSVIGGNVWLIHSVPPMSKVLNAQPSPRVKTPGVPDASEFLEGGGI